MNTVLHFRSNNKASSAGLRAAFSFLLMTVISSFGYAGGAQDPYDQIYDIVLNSEGRIILAGASELSAGRELALWRLNSDGSPDLSFGDGGLVTGTAGYTAISVNTGADNSISVVRYGFGEVSLSQLADGDKGIAINGNDAEEPAESQNSWTLPVFSIAGFYDNGDFFLLEEIRDKKHRLHLRRFLMDGSEDLRFADNAEASQTEHPSAPDGCDAIDYTIDEKDRIIISGISSSGMTLWRFCADGALDPEFGNKGIVILNNAGSPVNEFAAGITVNENGRIFVTGAIMADEQRLMAVWCLTPDGHIDDGFGNNGHIAFKWSGPTDDPVASWGTKIVIDAQSRIVVSGLTGNRKEPVSSSLAVWRYLPDGKPDESFGDSGWMTLGDYFEKAPFGYAVKTLIDPSGRIILAGNVSVSSHDIILVRLNPEGSPDRTFGTNGLIMYDRLGGFRGLKSN